jgi:Leucine-rich repeat (LRR) protein
LFSGSNEQKLETTKIKFNFNERIDFIPLDIFREFPNFNGIAIWNSDLSFSIINLFTKEFNQIKYLDLYNNKIQKIGENTFSELKDLKWICLSYNKIEFIKDEIFKNNLKLEYIDLNENPIKMINSKLFTNLDQLEKVEINSMNFRASDIKAINGPLQTHYNNFFIYEKNQAIEFLKKQLKFVRSKYESCLKNVQDNEVSLEGVHNKLNFVRQKYKLCIQELKDKHENSNINQIVPEVKVIKGNYDIIRNSYSFTDVTFELADNQIIEAHRHILEGKFFIFLNFNYIS